MENWSNSEVFDYIGYSEQIFDADYILPTLKSLDRL